MAAKTSRPLSPHPVLEEYYTSAERRRSRVDDMFDASAVHYDWINAMMSMGTGERYRRQALARIDLEPGMQLLDVGAGTGVVSLIAQGVLGDSGLVVAHDPSRGMLREACQRGVRRAVQGLGESLPYADNSFDRVTMSYALRHVADLRQLFSEFTRVLKPGGQVLLLEISRPLNPVVLASVRFYMKSLVPMVTRIFRRSADAQELMRYYWDTIEHCVPPATILDTMAEVGFDDCKRRVDLGIFSEYSGIMRCIDSNGVTGGSE